MALLAKPHSGSHPSPLKWTVGRSAGFGFLVLAVFGLGLLCVGAADTPSVIPKGYKLLYEQSFKADSTLRDFVMTDPKAWRVSREKAVGALELFAQSDYKPTVRSPVNIALIRDRAFGDFVLEVDLMQTGNEYNHRDMCVFFGVQSPTNFYYVHMATVADDHANNIFIVNNAPRIKIARETTKGVNWGTGIPHKVRLERLVADGTIKVYFDDLAKPIMVAEDKTFGGGFIGFGSFDDTGKIQNIRVWGPGFQDKPTSFSSLLRFSSAGRDARSGSRLKPRPPEPGLSALVTHPSALATPSILPILPISFPHFHSTSP